jgi:DNA-binding transcriptional regulator GbsR (MarR family)
MAERPGEKESCFLEEVGIVFENTGLPRMAGRLFGWLLISDPPYQSPSELADVLRASKGSVSTNVRLLMQLGLIERFVIPGERHNHYRLHEDAIRRTVQHGLEDEIKMFLELAERGLELIKGKPSVRKEWLERMRDKYRFLSEEFPVLMDRFEKWRSEHAPAHPAGRKSR